MRARLGPIDARDPGPQAVRPHQPFHAPTTHVMATPGQALLNPRTAVGSTAALEIARISFEQYPVLLPTRTHRPSPRRVESRARDRKEPAEPRHAEPLPLLFDEREDVGFRAEVNRMSFFSNACSSWSSVWARCSD